MPDFLNKLINDAKARIKAGYYDNIETVEHKTISLRQAIKSTKKNAIIAEIKPISPAVGPLRPQVEPVAAALELTRGGATALSVLTEPDNFGGSIENLRKIRKHVTVPILMKDIIVDQVQIQAATKTGADCILLIEPTFSRYRVTSMNDMIDNAHQSKLEVLLEVHEKGELERAMKTDADIIGINNRNLTTLEIDLQNTTHLMSEIVKTNKPKVIITESGIETSDDLRKLKKSSVDGFLIGSSIMLSNNLERKVREFVEA